MAEQTNISEPIQIDREIGDDPAELDAIAAEVVAGKPIKNARIKNLRALIEAVQRHPDAKLAPPGSQRGKDWRPPDSNSEDALTTLQIKGGKILEADCNSLDCLIELRILASFAGEAGFGEASFAGGAWFHGASFAGIAWFSGTSFAGEAWFDEASFAEDAWFDEASFAGGLSGDFRACIVRTATFAEEARALQRRHRPTALRRILTAAAVREWFRYSFGWKAVRSLGQLQILNRVSIIALFAVPIIVAFWPAVCAVAGAYHRGIAESHAAMDRLLQEIERTTEDRRAVIPDDIAQRIANAANTAHETSNRWYDHLQSIISESPPIGDTLALTFFAAVAVTLGLLVYQIWAPEEVRKFDEDEFIDRAHRRYPEDAKDRNDGLRRAIEQLQQIAKERTDRHPNFVKHHGDTIWIPPRDRIDWFEDIEPAPSPSRHANQARRNGEVDEAIDLTAAEPEGIKEPPQQRLGMVPGAERARITIEEGAKAEYWLKSRTHWGLAVLSFGFYLAGIFCLLAILWIQGHRVGEAAGWWGKPQQDHTGSAFTASAPPDISSDREGPSR